MKHPIPSDCRVHPTESVHWYCESCSLPLCTACKPYAEQLPREVHCPICEAPMSAPREESEEDSIFATPLKYVRQLPALTLSAAVALIATLGFQSLPGLLLALPLGALVLFLMIALATRAGEGRETLPTLRALSDIDQIEHCFRLLPLGLPFLALLTLAMASGSTAAAVAAWLLTAAGLPAALMASLVEESPGAAFNPSALARILRVVKKPYLRMVAAGSGAVVFVGVAAAATGGLPPYLQGALAFTATALVFALSARLGVVLRKHRRKLDYAAGVAAIDRPRRPGPAVYEPAQLAADAHTLLRLGKRREGRVLLGQALTRFPDDPQLNEQFDHLVSSSARPKEIRNHLERRMHRLIRSGQIAAATELWQRNSPLLDNWVPKVSETRYRLALELDDMGEHQMAFRLLISLPPEDRKFAHIADAWMEAARILEDRLGEPKRAAELRRLVQERYPEEARRWGARWQPAASTTRSSARARPASAHG